MMIEIADSLKDQAAAAGFASVEEYVADLAEKDAERLEIQKGIKDWKEGRVQVFEEFDQELRQNFGRGGSGKNAEEVLG